MDIKSIVRVFRFTELQTKADRDPGAKRPPTVKFLGVALALGLLLVLISFWSAPKPDVNGSMPLTIASSEPNVTNTTAPSDTAPSPAFVPADGPSEPRYETRPQDGP